MSLLMIYICKWYCKTSMKVKFCGMTNFEDALYASEIGADFVGFVFYEKSKRFIPYKNAKIIIEKLNKKVKTVGVFVNQNENEIKHFVNYCGLDYAQVYSDFNAFESIRVYRIKDKAPERVKSKGLILFDSFSHSVGGSGIGFDKSILRDISYKDRLFVAGGIDSKNVRQIIDFGVFGVDLVSSVEKYPGKKDFEKMKEFIKIAKGL